LHLDTRFHTRPMRRGWAGQGRNQLRYLRVAKSGDQTGMMPD
jgi:hypothetical protein